MKSSVNHNQLEILLVITNSPLLSVGVQSVDTVGTGQRNLSQPCSCVPTDYLLPPPSSLLPGAGTGERERWGEHRPGKNTNTFQGFRDWGRQDSVLLGSTSTPYLYTVDVDVDAKTTRPFA